MWSAKGSSQAGPGGRGRALWWAATLVAYCGMTEGAMAMAYPTGKAEISAIGKVALPTNHKSHKPQFMLALALVGVGVAFYDAYQLYNGQPLWCPPPINGCNEVLYMFCLAALLAYDPFSRGLRLAALIYSAIGVGFSIYFSYLQVTLIHAFCLYCLISAITTVLLFIAAISHFRARRTLELSHEPNFRFGP